MEEFYNSIPKDLKKYIDKFNTAPDNIKDCVYEELASEINVHEVEGMISSDKAWYLREKYLGLKR